MRAEDFPSDHHRIEHIGDGVYASFDGYHIWLTVERENGLERVALEPDVLDGLMRYRAALVSDFELGGGT